ncbi:hypothetical protein ABIB25_004087 [Nakamurella sp. UYEF19]
MARMKYRGTRITSEPTASTVVIIRCSPSLSECRLR